MINTENPFNRNQTITPCIYEVCPSREWQIGYSTFMAPSRTIFCSVCLSGWFYGWVPGCLDAWVVGWLTRGLLWFWDRSLSGLLSCGTGSLGGSGAVCTQFCFMVF